jgi:two-component sensor histidine kinase/Tfp pilus assembly protein PilF
MRFPYRVLCIVFKIILFLSCIKTTVYGQGVDQKTINRIKNRLNHPLSDTARIRLLLEMAKFHIYKPGELKLDLDSGEKFLNRAGKISDSLQLLDWQHKIQIMTVVMAMERGDEKKGRILFNRAVTKFQQQDDKFSEADLRFRFAVWLTTRGKYNSEVLKNFRQSAHLYRTLKKTALELNVLKEIASIHFDDGRVDLAEHELMDVLERYKAIRYPRLHYTYNLLSTISRVKGNFNKSLRFSLLSIEYMKQSGDSSVAANFYADLARIYMEIGNNAKGIEWYKKAIQKWRNNQRASFGVFVAAGYISEDLIAKGRAKEALAFTVDLAKSLPPISVIQRACFAQNLASCYNALGEFGKAERYYQQSLEFYRQSNMDFEVSQEAQRSMGKFYLARKTYAKAGEHLRKALKFNPQKLSTAALKDIHFMLFRVDSAQGNYISAIAHQKRQKELNDSILDSRKTREIEELQIQYETEKRKKDLVVLNNKTKLQQNKLEKADITQKYTLACLALMGIILTLLYSQNKLKNRTNQNLKVQKEEISVKNLSLEKVLKDREWLLKEVHHRVKNNLQIVISLLNTQSSYLDNDFALNALRESQHRMYSISLIHQKLYQSDNMAFVNMREYIMELTSYLKDSLDPAGDICFQFDLMPIELDINQAIPVGLILNEAITNAIKHAFQNKGAHQVNVSLRMHTESAVCLEIGDNGNGFPPEFDIKRSKSLGMNLIKGLSRQLDGDFKIRRQEGITTLIIIFTPKHTTEEERDF